MSQRVELRGRMRPVTFEWQESHNRFLAEVVDDDGESIYGRGATKDAAVDDLVDQIAIELSCEDDDLSDWDATLSDGLDPEEKW